jgi:hypothetical protein
MFFWWQCNVVAPFGPTVPHFDLVCLGTCSRHECSVDVTQ